MMTAQERMLKEVATKHFDKKEYSIIKLSHNDDGHASQYALCDKYGARVIFTISNAENIIFHTFDAEGVMSNHFFLENWIDFIKEIKKRS